MLAEKLLQKVSKIKRPRGERGGQKVKAQKSLRARTERGEYQPKKDFPQVPQYGSQLRELPHPASAEVEPRELPSSSASGSQVKPASNEQAFTESRPEQVAEPLSSARLITSSHRSPHPGELSRDTRGEPLRPRVGPSNLTRGPPPSRVLIVTDLHGVLDCAEFLKYSRDGKREETSGEIPLINKQAIVKLLNLGHHQVAVLSYIGADSYRLRSQAVASIRDLNQFVTTQGCSKQVGLHFCDNPSQKAGIVSRLKTAAFVDDKLRTCRETIAASQGTDVYFEAEHRPKDRNLYHVRSFAEFADYIEQSRFLPVADSPSWAEQFPIP